MSCHKKGAFDDVVQAEHSTLKWKNFAQWWFPGFTSGSTLAMSTISFFGLGKGGKDGLLFTITQPGGQMLYVQLLAIQFHKSNVGSTKTVGLAD